MDRVLVMERKSDYAWGYRYHSGAGHWERVDGGWLAGLLFWHLTFASYTIIIDYHNVVPNPFYHHFPALSL